MISVGIIKERIKTKDFTISYDEAIDLIEDMDVDYNWSYIISGPVKLLDIRLPMFSGVVFRVLEE